MGKQTGQLLERLKQMKKNQWAVVVLVGILLLVIAMPVSPGKEEQKQESPVQTEEIGSRDQAERLERKLEQVLVQVKGVGKVKVMITLKSSGEKVVEKDRTTSQRNTAEEEPEGTSRSTAEQEAGEETVYQRGEDGGQTPYIIEEKEPEIAGVMVVAQGGDQAVTAKNITEAVMALFGVEAHKIKVMKMN